MPGLVLIGAGMGVCLTSLNAILLETFDDQRAGSASGVVSTTQALGNALGVPMAGVVFFAADDEGIGHAFTLTAIVFVLVGLAVAALTRLIPGGGLDRRASLGDPAEPEPAFARRGAQRRPAATRDGEALAVVERGLLHEAGHALRVVALTGLGGVERVAPLATRTGTGARRRSPRRRRAAPRRTRGRRRASLPR